MESRRDLEQRLLASARSLCERRGFAALGFRSLAREAAVSPGALTHRFGNWEPLLGALVNAEARDTEAWLSGWTARLAAIRVFDADILARTYVEILEDWASNRRGSACFQAELRVAAGTLPAPVRDAVARISCVLSGFWTNLLKGRQPISESIGLLLSGLSVDELPFTVLLGRLPAYRLLRAITVHHLLLGLAAPDPDEFSTILAELDGLSTTGDAASAAGHSRGIAIAEAIADCLEAGRAGDLSHRSVAAAAGVPHTTVAHHFPTADALLRGGITALYRRIRDGSSGPDSEPPRLMIRRIANATHGMALTAARDPVFRPFATDMRWRRGENLWPHMPAVMGDGSLPGSHRLSAQAIAVALFGTVLLDARGELAEAEAAERVLGAARQWAETVRAYRTSEMPSG